MKRKVSHKDAKKTIKRALCVHLLLSSAFRFLVSAGHPLSPERESTTDAASCDDASFHPNPAPDADTTLNASSMGRGHALSRPAI
jgi:hypothetical protein